MTIPKKIKGVPLQKKEKKSTTKTQAAKKSAMAKSDQLIRPKKWQKIVDIEFEDEFLNNSLNIHNILE